MLSSPKNKFVRKLSKYSFEIPYYHMWGIKAKINQVSVCNKIKQTHRQREETSVYQWGGNRQGQNSIKGVRDTNGHV